MSLKSEFESSFGGYVDPQGEDSRRSMLLAMLGQSLINLITMVEPFDLAAMMTCAVSVDARQAPVSRLVGECVSWQTARQEAEDEFEDPDKCVFDPRVDDITVLVDGTVPNLIAFFERIKQIEGGNVYLGQVLACLVWAQRIPAMIPNLWKPKEARDE